MMKTHIPPFIQLSSTVFVDDERIFINSLSDILERKKVVREKLFLLFYNSSEDMGKSEAGMTGSREITPVNNPDKS